MTPVNQVQTELGVKSYTSWCYTYSGFGVLAKKYRLALNMHSKLFNIIEKVP